MVCFSFNIIPFSKLLKRHYAERLGQDRFMFTIKSPYSTTGGAFGREEEIRTLDTVTRILPFQGSSFNHSDTSLFGDAK
jgi:hypothetical protein